jgi:hypothetical protein
MHLYGVLAGAVVRCEQQHSLFRGRMGPLLRGVLALRP